MPATFMSLCNSHDYERLYFQKSIIVNCFIEPYVKINYSLSLWLSVAKFCSEPTLTFEPSLLHIVYNVAIIIEDMHDYLSKVTVPRKGT